MENQNLGKKYSIFVGKFNLLKLCKFSASYATRIV